MKKKLKIGNFPMMKNKQIMNNKNNSGIWKNQYFFKLNKQRIKLRKKQKLLQKINYHLYKKKYY